MRMDKGFTIVEISVVLIVIGLIVSTVFIFIPDAAVRAQDKERQSDIDTLHARLEELYQDTGAYPSAILASTFARLDPEVLIDPSGQSLLNNTPVATQADARATANPTASSNHYTYTAYPTSCTTACSGYILKAYIKLPAANIPNPYIKGGLYNN